MVCGNAWQVASQIKIVSQCVALPVLLLQAAAAFRACGGGKLRQQHGLGLLLLHIILPTPFLGCCCCCCRLQMRSGRVVAASVLR
jgi:hypothetical protein